jgi:homocysteine S-methyltransferase
MDMTFLEAIDDRPLVFDGAMGTQLYERGIYINKSFDDANLSRQELVETVHEEYIDAGADIITTNTFGSNRIKLENHGKEDQTEEINREGAEIAADAAGEAVFVAGSLGPTGLAHGMLGEEDLKRIRESYREQASALVEGGVDLLVFETFRQIEELRLAMEAAQEVCDLPMVAMMAFDEEEVTGDGSAPTTVVDKVTEWGADVVGANCMEGPSIIYDVVEKMVGRGVPIVAQPNAGYPRKVEDRLLYMATPTYFGKYGRRFFELGCTLVGGCCGTGPEHIERIAAAARMMGGGRVRIDSDEPEEAEEQEEEALEPTPASERTELASKIDRVWKERVLAPPEETPDVHRENFVTSVEVNPPSGLDPYESIEKAQMLVDGGADVVNTSDGPRAKAVMNNVAFGRLMQQELDNEVIVHVCGRDRNLLGMQSHLLGAHVLDLNNLCVITGDPPKVGDYPHATAVFDLDSIGILRMVSNLNKGLDPAGKPIGGKTEFFCATGAEPAARDYEREIHRLEKKKAAGANFVMTQPVYDPGVLDQFLEDIEHLEIPILVGLLPLASHRNAEFLHNEIPGMSVPKDIRDRMEAAGSGPEARREGVKIAQETLMLVKDRVVGAYFMPPFGRYEAALEILQCIPGYDEPPTSDDE